MRERWALVVTLVACTGDPVPSTPADDPDSATPRCDLGALASPATAEDPTAFAEPIYWRDGAALPPGPYQVGYVDGCMRYDHWKGWTIHHDKGRWYSWWLISVITDLRIVKAPGTVGQEVGTGSFFRFQDCVAANQALEPTVFDHVGGPIGLWLHDLPYDDDVPGPDGRNPTWRLEYLGDCADLP